jgi:hypothetical protein
MSKGFIVFKGLNVSLYLIEHHRAMKTYWWSGDIAPFILKSTLGGDEWPASHPSSFTPGVRAHGTHLVGQEAD